MRTESQLRSDNNDLMDPHWRPEPTKEITLISIIKKIHFELSDISSRFDKYSEEDLKKLDDDNMVIKITISPERVRRMRAAIKSAQ